jgi:hypothetical protein
VNLDRRQFLATALASRGFGGEAKPLLPAFSWDRIPVFNHMAKPDAHLTPDEAKHLARFPMVTVEKSHARGVGVSCEEGIYQAARQIKDANPGTKVLFYLNVVIDWPGYEASATFERHPEWRLRDRSGNEVTFRGRFLFDLSQPALREWWSDTVAGAMRRAALDGVFADGVPKVAMAEASNRKLWGDAKYEAVEHGLRELLALTKRKIGPEKILLINGLRGRLQSWKDGGLRYLEHADAAMIEHFAGVSSVGQDGRLNPEIVLADLDLMRQAAQKGKLIQVKAWPAFAHGFPDASKFPASQAERVRLARQQIEFPLAAFLIGAEKHCYFGYSWGYTLDDGWMEWYPEFDRKLGPPKGPAQRTGWHFTREFEHARVQVDLAREWGKVEWM